MEIQLSVFGAFRDFAPDGKVVLHVPDGARVADVRDALSAHALSQWPGFRPGLLASSAFASESAVLRDADPVPTDGRLAVLPPVSGG